MQNNDDWTPWVGWRKATLQIPIRLVVALAFCWGGFWLLRAIVGGLEAQIGAKIPQIPLALIGAVAIAAGAIAGLVMSVRLSDSTGLIGKHLWGPTCGLLVVGLLVFHWYVASTMPQWQQITFWTFSINGVAACVLMLLRFMRDS